MNEKLFWIWVSRLEYITCEDIDYLIKEYGTYETIFDLKEDDLLENKYLTESKKKRITNISLKKNLGKYLEYTERHEIMIISYKDKLYPEKLKFIDNKPVVLFVKGNIEGINNESAAIVGSRKCTKYGIEVTKYFSNELSKRKINIISGLAKGVDSIAHRCSIDNKSKTIAVLGHGLDFIYPKENLKLAVEILQNGGAIISEYPPGTSIRKDHFPRRNRIISGLSNIVIITEASKKSGSLITANHAIEQGKDVWVVPGSIFSDTSKGSNELIKDGANILTDISDICQKNVF